VFDANARPEERGEDVISWPINDIRILGFPFFYPHISLPQRFQALFDLDRRGNKLLLL